MLTILVILAVALLLAIVLLSACLLWVLHEQKIGARADTRSLALLDENTELLIKLGTAGEQIRDLEKAVNLLNDELERYSYPPAISIPGTIGETWDRRFEPTLF